MKSLVNIITTLEVSILIVLAIIDNILLIVIEQRKTQLNNKYYNFHKKHGLLKITLYKVVAISIIIYVLISPAIYSGRLAAPILLYGVFVITLLIDFMRT